MKGARYILRSATCVLTFEQTADATERASVFANVSLVTDDRFGDDGTPVALNGPSSSVKGGVDYGLPAGLSVGATAQYVDAFPVRWGPYIGRVDAHTRLDLRAGFRVPAVPGLRLDLSAKNVLGTEHRAFVGPPEIGRMGIVRLTYELPERGRPRRFHRLFGRTAGPRVASPGPDL